MEHFSLEKDVPGNVISFKIPSEVVAEKVSRGESITINYRHLYKRLTGRKRSAAASVVTSFAIDDELGISLAASAAGGRHMMRSSNTFENVIDKLERKYYVNTPIDEGDSNSSGTRSTATGTPNSNAVVNSVETGDKTSTNSVNGETRLKRKKKAVNDAYDYSDPFLDDSEAVQEYEGRLIAKRRKNGNKVQYMVSAGNVEGDEVEVMDEEDEDKMDQSPTSTTAAAIVKAIKPKSTSSSGKTAVVVPSSTSALAGSSESVTLTAAKPKQPPVPKPLWSPPPAILAALQQFKDAAALINNIGKNAGLPSSLEGPLLHLDTVVMRHFTAKELAKVSGYYEFVQTCLGGGQFPIGRVKSALARLYARETARKAHEKLSGLVETFKTDIVANIRSCAEEKQPPFQEDAISTSNEEDIAVLPSSTNSSTRYAYQFVWTTSYREKLLTIRATAGEWLSLENAYRSKLTNFDKKGLEPKNTSLLDPMTELHRILGDICDAFPAACLHGDIAALHMILNIDAPQENMDIPAPV